MYLYVHTHISPHEQTNNITALIIIHASGSFFRLTSGKRRQEYKKERKKIFPKLIIK